MQFLWHLAIDHAPVNDPRVELSQATKVGWSLVIAVGWMTAYFLGIRRAYLDKVVAIPLFAIPFNWAWEFSFGFLFVDITPPVGVASIVGWFFIDIVIVVQAFRYGQKELPGPPVRRSTFLWSYAVLFPFAYALMIMTTRELGDYDGAYTAFWLNVFMSFAFITMLHRRQSSAGQNIYIAFGKMLGTFGSSALFALFYPHRPLLFLSYVTIFVLDWVYLVLLYRRLRADGRSPWRTV
jgi:hypothetical protein